MNQIIINQYLNLTKFDVIFIKFKFLWENYSTKFYWYVILITVYLFFLLNGSPKLLPCCFLRVARLL